jgi:thiamine biosynthesis lipoprotein
MVSSAMKSLSRRQFTSVLSSLGSGVFLANCSRGNNQSVSATSTGFGTTIGITLVPPSTVDAEELLDLAFAEIARWESIFSLFDPASPLRQLNDQGILKNPPPELIAVLELSDRIHRITGGAFDPTVQPLWELYESHFATRPTDSDGPSPSDIAETRQRTGWENVAFDSSEIRFSESGMKLTLNGIAPGVTADAIADQLMSEGVKHALIDCGEFRSIGTQSDGSPWPVAIRGPENDHLLGKVELAGNAVATSAGYATAFDLEERFHHLFHPQDDKFAPARRVVTVEAPTAGLADALATAAGAMVWEEFANSVKVTPEVRVTQYDAN